MRTLRMNLMYSHGSMFLHMFNLFYDFFVIFIVLVCLLWLLAREWCPSEHLSILTASCRVEILPKNYTTSFIMCIIIIKMY
jgi:hypothetical protein